MSAQTEPSVDVLAAQVRAAIASDPDHLLNHRTAHAALDALVARVTEAERERDWQMGSKLEAQRTLLAVTEALDLRLADLGNGWLEAAPKILARIETIVDEGNRGFTERDEARAALADARNALEAARWFQRLFDSIVVADENDGTHRLYTDADLHNANVALREVLARLDGSAG